MDPKQSPNYMQKAIQKASKLIDLLTNENRQLKSQNLSLQSEIDQIASQNAELISDNQAITNKLKQLETINAESADKITVIQKQLKKCEDKLKDKTAKNKQLYQKLGEYVTKNQELAKNMEKQKKKNLSLSNENQYLMKNLVQHQQKQNRFLNYCVGVETQFRKEIGLVDRTKQAFARKCQQLKIENHSLCLQVTRITGLLSQYSVKEQKYLQQSADFIQIQTELKRANETLSYIVESTLSMKPEVTLYLKVQQIKNYLAYRMQHIQNLIKSVMEGVGKYGATGELRDLGSLTTHVNRLSAYLSQLSK